MAAGTESTGTLGSFTLLVSAVDPVSGPVGGCDLMSGFRVGSSKTVVWCESTVEAGEAGLSWRKTESSRTSGSFRGWATPSWTGERAGRGGEGSSRGLAGKWGTLPSERGAEEVWDSLGHRREKTATKTHCLIRGF